MHAAEGILTTRGGMTSPRRRGGARHGQALRLGRRHDPRRLRGQARMTCGGVTLEEGRRHHHRRLDRPGAARRRRRCCEPELSGDFATLMEWADAARRMKVRANAETPRRRAHGAQVRRRGHRALPHRAHVLRRRPHRRGARDDPRRRRGGPPRRARQAAADAARGLRRAVRDHVGPAGDDPPARSAAARVPAAHRGRDGRGREPRWASASTSCSARAPELHEFNPMLGLPRRAASPSPIPEIAEMQARAIFEGAVEAEQEDRRAGRRPRSWCRW